MEEKKLSEITDGSIEKSKWIFGIFYFNPKDKRIFPPKRISALGWTVNFANPYSIIFCLLIIAALIFIF